MAKALETGGASVRRTLRLGAGQTERVRLGRDGGEFVLVVKAQELTAPQAIGVTFADVSELDRHAGTVLSWARDLARRER